MIFGGGKNTFAVPFLRLYSVWVNLTLSCFSTTETTFRHVHSASEEGVDGDDDDDDDDDDEMFEQDADLFDEKVRS